MKKKRIIASILFLTIGAVILSGQVHTIKEVFSFESKAQASAKVPTHILYDQLFRLIVSVRRKAEIQRLTGKNVTTLPNYIKESANLTDEENQKLTEIALEFTEEVEAIDSQASEIIAQVRESFIDGEIGEGQQVPPPPAELVDLQNQRNSLVLSFRDRLNDAFGKKTFGAFDEFMHKEFVKGFQASGTNPRN